MDTDATRNVDYAYCPLCCGPGERLEVRVTGGRTVARTATGAVCGHSYSERRAELARRTRQDRRRGAIAPHGRLTVAA